MMKNMNDPFIWLKNRLESILLNHGQNSDFKIDLSPEKAFLQVVLVPIALLLIIRIEDLKDRFLSAYFQ